MHIELFLVSYFMGQFDDVNNGTIMPRCKSSCSQTFFEIGVLKHFVIFTGKNLCGDSNIFFPVNIVNISSTTFAEHLWWLLLSPKQIKRNKDILRKYTLRNFLLKYNDAKKHISKHTLQIFLLKYNDAKKHKI